MSSITKPFSECQLTLFREPYVYGYIDNFLPDPFYTTLSATFLDPGDIRNHDIFKHGKKRVVFHSPPVPDNIPLSPEWRQLVSEISDWDYIDDCYNWVRDNYNQTLHPNVNYSLMTSERFKMKAGDLTMQCEFSSLEEGALLAPHSD